MRDYHFHNQYEIILYLVDGVELEIANRSFRPKRGDVFLINHNIPHKTNCPGRYERCVLMMSEHYLEPFCQSFQYDFLKLFRKEGLGTKLFLNKNRLEKVLYKLDTIGEAMVANESDRHKQVRLNLMILDLINYLDSILSDAEFHRGSTTNRSDKGVFDVGNRVRVEEIKDFIIRYSENTLRLDDLADRFNLSPSYLSRMFKRETGFTISQYIAMQKISRAKEMLLMGLSVTDVASNLSYSSSSHFIAHFKRTTGITPKQYANERRHEAEDLEEDDDDY